MLTKDHLSVGQKSLIQEKALPFFNIRPSSHPSPFLKAFIQVSRSLQAGVYLRTFRKGGIFSYFSAFFIRQDGAEKSHFVKKAMLYLI